MQLPRAASREGAARGEQRDGRGGGLRELEQRLRGAAPRPAGRPRGSRGPGSDASG